MNNFFRYKCANRKARAFTLIELVFVIGLAAIVFFIGIPGYNRFRQNRAAASSAMQFLMDVRKVRQLCINLEQETIFYINRFDSSPPNQYRFSLPGTTRTITRDIQGEFNGARLIGAGGSAFKITEGGEFSRDGVADALVPNPSAGGYNYMFVSFFYGSNYFGNQTYQVNLYTNGESILVNTQ